MTGEKAILIEIKYKKKVFHNAGDEALSVIAQRCGTCLTPRNIQDQVDL